MLYCKDTIFKCICTNIIRHKYILLNIQDYCLSVSLIDEVISISGNKSNLTLSGILTSAVYSCTASNMAGNSMMSSSEVSVLTEGKINLEILITYSTEKPMFN